MPKVSVEYDFGKLQSLVTIQILVDKDGSTPPKAVLTPALAALPKGLYRVAWKLVAGEGVRDPEFDEEGGLYIKTQPPNVDVGNSARRENEPNFWDATLTNNVNGPNAVNYGVKGTFQPEGSEARAQFTESDFDLDPAIAVLPDPPP